MKINGIEINVSPEMTNMRMANFYGKEGAFKYVRLFAERSTALTHYRLCKAREWTK